MACQPVWVFLCLNVWQLCTLDVYTCFFFWLFFGFLYGFLIPFHMVIGFQVFLFNTNNLFSKRNKSLLFWFSAFYVTIWVLSSSRLTYPYISNALKSENEYFFKLKQPPFTGYQLDPPCWLLKEHLPIITLKTIIWVPRWFGFGSEIFFSVLQCGYTRPWYYYYY